MHENTFWLVTYDAGYAREQRWVCDWTVIEKTPGESIDQCMYRNGLIRAVFDGGVENVRLVVRPTRSYKASMTREWILHECFGLSLPTDPQIRDALADYRRTMSQRSNAQLGATALHDRINGRTR